MFEYINIELVSEFWIFVKIIFFLFFIVFLAVLSLEFQSRVFENKIKIKWKSIKTKITLFLFKIFELVAERQKE